MDTIILNLKEIDFKPLDVVRSYRVNSGTYTGAYRRVSGGNINWYFSNLALTELCEEIGQNNVRTYLNLYLSRRNTTNHTIQDVSSNLTTLIDPDSHDSYAATLISLAWKYHQTYNDLTWLTNNKNALKDMAYSILVTQIKTNGLCRTFKSGVAIAGKTEAQMSIGYLMDNVEVYQGLVDLAEILKVTNDADVAYYSSFIPTILNGINNLWDASKGAFKFSDISTVGNLFYPDITANMMLEVYNLPLPEFLAKFKAINNFIEATKTGVYAVKNDPFPWGLVAKYYQTRGDEIKSCMYIDMMAKNFTTDLTFFPIHDLAYFYTALTELTAKYGGKATLTLN